MKFTVYSDKGGRVSNEDCARVADKDGVYLFAVADGLGDKGGGELASRLAVDAAAQTFLKAPELSRECAARCMGAAHNLIIERRRGTDAVSDMATTMALLITDGKSAVWAHIGDTRIYVLRRGSIEEITNDHSAAFDSFTEGEIDFSEIRESRVRNRLRRVLGDRISHEFEVSEVLRLSGAYSFLICTDGLWEYVSEDEIERCHRASLGAKGWGERMLAIVQRRADRDADNCSFIAVRMQMTDAM